MVQPDTMPQSSRHPAQWANRALSGLLAAELVLGIGLSVGNASPAIQSSFTIAMLTTAVLAVLVVLALELPVQNVLAVTLITLAVPTLAWAGGKILSAPQAARGSIPAILAVWFVAILPPRFVAKMLLNPWRGNRGYGYWVLLATSVLAGFTCFAAQQIAVPAGRQQGEVWSQVVLWMSLAVLTQVAAFPWLLPKTPSPYPTAHTPVLIWGGPIAYAACILAVDGFWARASALGFVAAAVCWGALRGLRASGRLRD